MGRRTLVDDLVDGLLDDILSGKLKAHDAIPSEADIAKAYDVSRLTVREALKALRAQNILYVKAGRGTFVNPTDNWTGLDAIFKAASHGNGADQVSVGLIEMRRMWKPVRRPWLPSGTLPSMPGRWSSASRK